MIEAESKEEAGYSGENDTEGAKFGAACGKETSELSASGISSEDSKEEVTNHRYVHVDHNILSSVLGGYDNAESKDPTTFYCQICFENNDESVAFQLPCKHQFCKECLVSYVTSKVTDGKVYPVCFFIDEDEEKRTETEDTTEPRRAHQKHHSCGAEIPQYVLESLLHENPTMLEKYRRYKFAKENTNARECPFCAVWNIVSPEDLAQPNGSKITCMNSECQKVYCFYHANAHDFDIYPTCAEYNVAMAPQMKATEDYINTCSKPCPGCHIYVSKTGGCNHMKCQCGVCFCWLCGKQIDDSIFPAHFQWWNPSGCSNLQMNEANEPSTCSRINAALLSCLQIIVLGPLTLASTVTSSLLCCSCIVLKLQMQRPLTAAYVRTFFSTCITSWGAFWMFVFFIPLVIVGGSVAAAVVLVCIIVSYPCYAIHRVQQNQYPWPDWVTYMIRWVAACFQPCCGYNATSVAYPSTYELNGGPPINPDGSLQDSHIASSNSADNLEQTAVELNLHDVEQGGAVTEYEDFSFTEGENSSGKLPVSICLKGGYSSAITTEPSNSEMEKADAQSDNGSVNSAVVLGDIDIESPRAV